MERQARKDADIVYSGFETMKSNFLDAMSAQLTPSAAEPLYLRPAAILVRPGNPKHIKRITDRLKLGVKVLVVNGSGQGEFEEDVAGRTEQILLMKALRDDIVEHSKNSALAKQSWTEHPDIDVWLIWNIWQVANPSLAEVVPIRPDAVYRDFGIAITHRGASKDASMQFVDYLNPNRALSSLPNEAG